MTRATVSLSVVLALASIACTGTDVGNPQTDGGIPGIDAASPVVLSLDFALHNQQAMPVRAAWLAVERIRLRSAAACDGEARVDLEGPIVVDLLAAGPPAALSGLDVPAEGYCRFEVKWNAFSSGLPPGTPPALVGATIAIEGERGDGTPFLLRSARDDEMRLDAVNGAFTIGEATGALFVGLDVMNLFAGVDLDTATVAADGTIYIDGESNPALLDIFDGNLRAAAELFDDDDGDGELADGEAGDLDALAR